MFKKFLILFQVIFILTGCSSTETKTIDTEIKSHEENLVLICDGIDIVENCEIDGISYLVYRYYPPVEEVSHFETKTTYEKEIVGNCTLCNDGTRSPSCSTGSGTCSWHGGVAEWNAPIYENVPTYKQIKIVDTPATPERFEKIIK